MTCRQRTNTNTTHAPTCTFTLSQPNSKTSKEIQGASIMLKLADKKNQETQFRTSTGGHLRSNCLAVQLEGLLYKQTAVILFNMKLFLNGDTLQRSSASILISSYAFSSYFSMWLQNVLVGNEQLTTRCISCHYAKFYSLFLLIKIFSFKRRNRRRWQPQFSRQFQRAGIHTRMRTNKTPSALTGTCARSPQLHARLQLLFSWRSARWLVSQLLWWRD